MMLLSNITLYGLRITGDSISICIPQQFYLIHYMYIMSNTVLFFVELVEYIITISVFLSNMCQDPLESFSGSKGNENPNVWQFFDNTQALRVINGADAHVRGNYRSDHENGRK